MSLVIRLILSMMGQSAHMLLRNTRPTYVRGHTNSAQRQGRRLKKWRQRLITRSAGCTDLLDYQGRKHPSSEHTARPDRCRCPDARLEEIVQQEQGGRDDAVQTQGWCRNREVQEIESGISGISGQRTSKTKRAGATVIEPARASGADLGWA